MGKGFDIQFVRENYQRLTDDELVRVATQDAAGLSPEAQEVVKQEIERRKLDTNIIKAVLAQNKTYTIQEVDNYCDIIRKLNCPSCGSTLSKLNATMTSEVMSAIVFTHWSKKLIVGCPDCLDKANNNALLRTALIGWWGFPWGVIRTPIAIGHNIKGKRTNHVDTPNDYLRSFTLSKIGQIEICKDNKEKLQRIISGD